MWEMLRTLLLFHEKLTGLEDSNLLFLADTTMHGYGIYLIDRKVKLDSTLQNFAWKRKHGGSIWHKYPRVPKISFNTSVTRKNRKMSIKVAQKLFHYKNKNFWLLYKKCLRMKEILAK